MGDFKFAPAAFAGFDLLRRRPITTLGVALVGAVLSLGGRLTAIGSAHFSIFKQTPPQAIAVYSTVFMLTLTGLAIAIIGAAVARLAANPGVRAAGVRLGPDEARLFLLTLLVFPGLLIVLLGVAVGAAVGVATGVGAEEDALMWTAAGIGTIAAFVPASRLWPAGVMTVQAEAMRLRAAWRLTRKRSWKIFAVFCLAMALALLIGVGGNVALNNGLGKLPAMAWSAYQPLPAALKSAFGPLQLCHLLVQGLVFGFGFFLQAAPATVILGALAEDRASDQAAVFD